MQTPPSTAGAGRDEPKRLFRFLVAQARARAGAQTLTWLFCRAFWPSPLSARYPQAEVAKIVEMPWSLAIGADARFTPGPGTNFPPPQSAKLLGAYSQLLAGAASTDLSVFMKWAQVRAIDCARCWTSALSCRCLHRGGGCMMLALPSSGFCCLPLQRQA